MQYLVENVAGGELETHKTLAEATRGAVERLQSDPEIGMLYVFEIGRKAPAGTHVKTITHGPDAHWNSVVVVLDPGEKVEPPDDTWKQDRETDAYELSDPKHPNYFDTLVRLSDNRTGK